MAKESFVQYCFISYIQFSSFRYREGNKFRNNAMVDEWQV